MIKEMTSGSPIKLILWFSLPVLLGNLFQHIYLISDLMLVGRFLGLESLAAVGAMMPMYGVMIMMSFGFTNGLSIVIAQRFGAKDITAISRSFGAGILLSGLWGVLLTGAVMFFLPHVMAWMNVPENISDEAELFIKTLTYGCMAMVYYNYLANVLRALGDSKTPLYFLIFSCVFNIILNVCFIVGLKMGVVGSALGSVISQIVSAGLCWYYIYLKFLILRLHKPDFALPFKWVYEHLRLAVPMMIQFSVIGLGAIIIQSVCNTFGTDAIAAMATCIRIEQLAALPLYSMGAAIVTFAAQNFGAHRIRRIRQGVFQSSIFSLLVSIFVSVWMFLWGEEMVLLFIKEPDKQVIEMACLYLQITSLFYCFLGQIFVFRQVLQGMGQSIFPMISGFMELFMRSFAAIILAAYYGFLGICWASPIAWIGSVAVVAPGYVWMIRKYRYRLTKKERMTPWPFRLFVKK